MKQERSKQSAAAPQDDWLIGQLRDPELSVEYLNAALAGGDQAAFMLALRNVARARGGVAAVARHTGMNRVAMSRALSVIGNPELRSLTKILGASGLRFMVARNQPRARRGMFKRNVPIKMKALRTVRATARAKTA